MSSKSNFQKGKSASRYDNLRSAEVRQLKSAIIYEVNSKRKNHVSEDTKSRGGFPYHFEGPVASTKTEQERVLRNRRKRDRQKLAA